MLPVSIKRAASLLIGAHHLLRRNMDLLPSFSNWTLAKNLRAGSASR